MRRRAAPKTERLRDRRDRARRGRPGQAGAELRLSGRISRLWAFRSVACRDGSNLLDGPPGDDAGDAVDMTAYPVPAQRRNEQKALAARYGLPAESDRSARAGEPARTRARDGPGSGTSRGPDLDASEGTALDPLRNKSWDLTHAQVVPAMTIR